MRVVSSSSLLFTSLVASSVSLPSLAAPVRARRDSIYERQEVGSPLPAAFESSANTLNLAGLVAPPTTPAFRARDNHVLGGAVGDFKHEFEGLINALEVSSSPVPAPTQSKKQFPSSLSKLSQSTTLAPSGVASSAVASSTTANASSSPSASILPRGDSFFEGLIGALDVTSSSAASGTNTSTSTSASANPSAGILPRGDSFFEGLIGALSAPAPPSSASAPPPPPSNTPALPSNSLALASEGQSALSTPTLPPQPTNTPALLARSFGARNMIDDFIGALDVSTSAHPTPAPTSTSASASATASGLPSTASVQSVLAHNGSSGGMLDGYYNAASAAASPTPSLDARGGDDVLDELIGALGVLGGHAHSTTRSQTTSSPALPMTFTTLGTRDEMLDGLIGALDVSLG